MATPMSTGEVQNALQKLNGWEADGNVSITKSFKFDDHIEAMGFVNRVAMAAEKMDHHPDLRIVYNTVTLTLSSHDASGVTSRDIQLAEAAERYA
jgi:4a-hydroxytetrahydrobiopterin dehydratase